MPNPLIVWVWGNLFKPETFGMTSYVLTPQKKTRQPDAFTEHLAESEVDVPRRLSTTIDGSLGQIFLLILLMEEILHHLGCLKPCK